MNFDNEYQQTDETDCNYLMLVSEDGTCLLIEPDGTIQEAKELDEPILLEIGDLLLEDGSEDYFDIVTVSLTIAEAREMVKTLVNLIHDLGGELD